MKKEGNRLPALEGLRGIAAIVVVFYHISLIFYLSMTFGPGIVQNAFFENKMYGSIAGFLVSGTFAVGLFFVLSGFVLSIGFFETGKTSVIKKLAAKRYIRLMVPALASVLIAWLLISLKLSQNSVAAMTTHSPWLNEMWNLTPNLFDALKQGTWGIFFNGEASYNPVLWTMTYEFIGSFIVFGALMLFGKLPKRWVVYAFLVVATFQTWFLGFIIGMIMADVYSQKTLFFKKQESSTVGWGALVLGLIFGGYPLATTANTPYGSMTIEWLSSSQNLSVFVTIGATLVVFAVLKTPQITRLLSMKYVTMLGKYTYSLYLTHKLVLFTFTVGVFLWLNTIMGYNVAVVWSVLISLPLIIVVTYLFERHVDAPAIRASGIFANWLLGIPQAQGPDAYTYERKRFSLKPKITWPWIKSR